ncbi:F protein (gpF) (protein gp30) [Bordetella ansorpii]|uniref:F protein (GpF) (Protein gp30) n=1 Tax=Bordetella ansorpii TaxID=288768 RepID=A0A157SX93_9BORD|nr:phage minor head protein [Bordetella ansorpii]SAI74576.1 F protein (gpF) (protein gp30) [Bordetella ansorpii]
MAGIELEPLPPQEAVDFFRQKGYRLAFSWQDMPAQEHAAAFTVAKAMQMDVLQDIRGAVDRAIADGTTWQDFRRALGPALQDKGWWGKREMVDPVTGETVTAQLGSDARLRRIFDTNLATAYGEGQWERIQRNVTLFPYLQYLRSSSEHPRLSHAAWAGKIFRADDPWWQAHMPAKEWGCKCGVLQLTQRQVDQMGLTVEQPPPERYVAYTNSRTGETVDVPQGVHPAFHYPPGLRRANLARSMMDKADAAAATTAARVLTDGADLWAPLVQAEFHEFVGRYAAPQRERRELGQRRVVGAFAPGVVSKLQAAGKLSAPDSRATIHVLMSKLRHLIGEGRTAERQAKGAGVEFVSELPADLRRIGEAWLDGNRVVLLCTSPTSSTQVVKIVVDLDVQARGASAGNVVVSMEMIDPESFTRRGLVNLM